MSNATENPPRVERDGKVAVIVSPGFGAGWSTWASDLGAAAVFAPDVVEWIEGGKVGDTDFAEKYGYTGGLSDAEIEWVPKGCRFEINEYDGAESLHILSPTDGYMA